MFIKIPVKTHSKNTVYDGDPVYARGMKGCKQKCN